MDWGNERYVRVYTRDTATWKLMDWRAHTVLLHMLRKADRAGVIDVGEDGVLGLAAVLELPLEIVEAGIEQLCKVRKVDQVSTVIWAENGAESAFVLPNFIEAQEAKQDDAHRKREERARRRDRKMASAKHLIPSRNVTSPSESDRERHGGSPQLTPSANVSPHSALAESAERPTESRNVTSPSESDRNRHGGSQPVTPIRSEPDPSLAEHKLLAPARAIPRTGTDASTDKAAEREASDPGAVRRRLWNDAWSFAGLEHANLKSEGVDRHARNCWSGIPPADSPDAKLLFARIDELLVIGDYDDARECIHNRVLVAAAEARHKHGHLQFFTPMRMWNAESFAIAAALSPEQIANGTRAGPAGSKNGWKNPEPPNRPMKKFG